MEKTKVSLTSFKEFSPDGTPCWVINVIITRVRRKQNYIFLPQIPRIFTERMIQQLSITP